MITAYYLSCFPHPHIPYFANISGRYDLTRILKDSRYAALMRREGEYDESAYVDWKVKVAGKDHVHRITHEGVRFYTRFLSLPKKLPSSLLSLSRGRAHSSAPLQNGTTPTSTTPSLKT